MLIFSKSIFFLSKRNAREVTTGVQSVKCLLNFWKAWLVSGIYRKFIGLAYFISRSTFTRSFHVKMSSQSNSATDIHRRFHWINFDNTEWMLDGIFHVFWIGGKHSFRWRNLWDKHSQWLRKVLTWIQYIWLQGGKTLFNLFILYFKGCNNVQIVFLFHTYSCKHRVGGVLLMSENNVILFAPVVI